MKFNEKFTVDKNYANTRIDRWLKLNTQKFPQSFVEKLLRSGKIKVNNKKINHVHIPNKFGNFQNIEIKTNSFGQRDIEYDNNFLKKHDRSFLIIGSSIPLGWGVKQDKTFTSRLNEISKKNKKKWLFINGGVGNYNTERYVNNYLENWSD